MIEKIKSILGDSIDIIKKYPLTFIVTILFGLLMTVSPYENDTYYKVIASLVFISILTFFVETVIKDNKEYYYIGSIIFGIFTDYILFWLNPSITVALLFVGLYSCILLYAIYVLSLKTNSLGEYLLKIFNNNIILCIFGVCIQAGLLFITFIIEALLMNDFEIDLFLRVETFILFVILLPGEILCFTYLKNKTINQVNTLVKYVLFPLCTIALMVIYLYLFKVLFVTGIPSNQVFAIIGVLLVVAIPTYIAVKELSKNLEKILKVLPYTFIPLICMQIYCIGIRIINYGISIDRYLGMMFVLIEIIATLLMIYENGKYLNKIFIFLIGTCVISFIIPYINIIDTSYYSQLNRLTSIYKEGTSFNSLSKEDKIIVQNIYNYINRTLDKKDKLPSYINGEEIDKYNQYNRYKEVKTIDYSSSKLVEIEGFSKIEASSFSDYSLNNEDKIKVNEYLKECTKNGEVINNYFELDDNRRYYVSSLYINYNEYDEINYYELDGYILYR